jgi:hypothetical protein
MVEKVWHRIERTDGPQIEGRERRRELRTVHISPCTFAMMHSTGGDVTILEEGEGTAVNDSGAGMRVLLGIAPPRGQLLEIQTAQSLLKRSIYLVEVCWTKPLREDTQGGLYLVGCRLMFGPSHYWSF